MGARLRAAAAGILIAVAAASPALSEELEGNVHLYGSALHAQTLITVGQDTEGARLCTSDMEQRIRHLTDLLIAVAGDWELTKSGDRDCFEAKNFRVLRASSGREAVSGQVLHEGAIYVVVSAEGRRTLLADLPEGVKKLLGDKVILDVKPLASPMATEASKVVVSYRPWP